MKIIKQIEVPTGKIIIANGELGKIEFLSLGDYGANINLNQHKAVPGGLTVMPLTEKWVITISTQYGCSMGCSFCDVPLVGPGINATVDDLKNQIVTAMNIPGSPTYTKRLNIHFARMGEPSWNPAVLDCAVWIKDFLSRFNPHPVVSTMMPKKNRKLREFIYKWMVIKNRTFFGNAGLQLSINSTDEKERSGMFSGNAHKLLDISNMMRDMETVGRKITLNFAVANYTVDTDLLAGLFSPDKFIIKLTPMHKTNTAVKNGIETEGDYATSEPYEELERRFNKSGFETLVFIAGVDEDMGRITCGNAILSGSKPETINQ